MATYDYDDFHVTFTPGPDETYEVRALGADRLEHLATFTVPLSTSDLELTVRGLAESHSRSRRGEGGAPLPPGAPPPADGSAVRDIGRSGPPQVDAERLGTALADALLGGEMGQHYDDAVRRAAETGRGLRLSLSLAGAPALLNLPWEFLYRRPRFLASQRNSPLVRHLDSGSMAPPPSIASTVAMLGVIASPTDLTPLDVASERERVEQAVAKVAKLGRIKLDWLEPATPRTLRQTLRDDSYHILHYVGHSDFTPEGEALLFLEDEDRRSKPIDSTALANLLSDQTQLRLVVLNSCDGARTSLVDPYAGVATTLIQLGVPAVVAMQFEITDGAAIVFADELYTNLIGRQDPIDAAVAEARKAIYIEVDKVEWATPVLFVRDPEVELFRFEVQAAPLPPPPPPIADEELLAPPPPPPWWKRWVALVAAAAVVLGAATALFVATRGGEADPVLADTFHVPSKPFRIAASGSSLWVTNEGSSTVTRIEAATGVVLEEVDIGGTPAGVDADENGVWVANYEDDTVVRIDPTTGDRIGDPIAVADGPRNVLVTESAVWVAAYGADMVSRIDVESGEVTSIAVGDGPRGVADGGDGSIWVTNSDDGTVSRIDASNNDVRPVTVGGTPSGITATEGSVWVTNADDETVVRIDPATNEVVAPRIPVPEDPEVLVTDGSDVWVSSATADTVSRIDAESGEVTFTLEVGDGPKGLAVTPGHLWVAEYEADTVSRIDLG